MDRPPLVAWGNVGLEDSSYYVQCQSPGLAPSSGRSAGPALPGEVKHGQEGPGQVGQRRVVLAQEPLHGDALDRADEGDGRGPRVGDARHPGQHDREGLNEALIGGLDLP